MSKIKLLGGLFSLCLAALLGFYLYLQHWQTQSLRLEQEQVFQVKQGDRLKSIAQRLQAQAVLDSATWFELLVRLQGHAGQLKAGYYVFSGLQSPETVMYRLIKGKVAHFSVTIAEGLRSDEILQQLSKQTAIPLPQWQAALQALLPASQREGYLLPETYDYIKPLNPLAFLKQMQKAQEDLLHSLSDDRVSRQRLRIIASIIEKETSVDHERALIAAVIEQRLKKHMRLQMDPTVIYGLWKQDGKEHTHLHRRELKKDTPWNTYTRHGLPATPICNPGAASLRAAAKPAKQAFLYFVATGHGGHAFATDLATHQANIQKWLRLKKTQSR